MLKISRYPQLFVGSSECSTTEFYSAIHWLLRFSCAFCFIGHGAWGIITKAGWVPFFAVFGIPENMAWSLMPVMGTIDILAGISVLLFPTKAVLLWMSIWATTTALLRPLAGMSFWEFFERAGNYGPAIALFLIALTTASSPNWLEKIRVQEISDSTLKKVEFILRLSMALLLIGHGGFGAFEVKPMLIDHWNSIGVPATAGMIRFIGYAEILAGLWIFFKPSRALILAIFCWKVSTELLYPISGSMIDTWEWVERGGDYFAPLTLLILLYSCPKKMTPPGQ